ncbi:hypothetical protein IJG93_02935 [Candidatus Saccharibacteria bacterium]|nr:hypothetical protein [Candidatus Saccharibacteria bacterium]
MASAGTIVGDSNFGVATQSICPRGWILPNITQVSGMAGSMYVSNFLPVAGGSYANSGLWNTKNGYWWLLESYDNISRRLLAYTGNSVTLSDTYAFRRSGAYIR